MEFWQQLAERNGPWAIFLLIVLIFLWKWVLPFVQKRIDAAEQALREQIAAGRDERRADAQLFADTLRRVTDEQTAALRQMAVSFDTLVERINEQRDDSRRRR